ncbi:MAG TPA: DUF484 family protein [Verrucomicrobiae bacterium]|nr:DUF484 family protein [Verrucomicrobiae bacterium]
MSEAGPETADLDERQVVAFLRANPDFLARHPELLDALELRHSSGAAVSLIERQVEILRGKSTRLEDRLKTLLDAARDNESRAANVHKLARSLIRAPTLAATIAALRKCLREDFNVDEAWVGISAGALKRHDIEGLYVIEPAGPVAKAFDDFFRTRLLECGPLDEPRARLLFPQAKQAPKSAAIVPLEKERDLGMLVLASADPERFQPRQGRLFLDMTAELVSAAVRARLG